MLRNNYIPSLPFPDFKWKWASYQCTEGLNDPLYLLGVLYRLNKLDDGKTTYSSKKFADEMYSLDMEIRDKTSHNVDLSSRTGERNIMRNSKQYWTSLGLVSNAKKGIIQLTDFGKAIANHNITQTEFATITIQTFRLPNEMNMNSIELKKWEEKELEIYPLRLILRIMQTLYKINPEEGYVTNEELYSVIIPLSGIREVTIEDYTHFVLLYREGSTIFENWPKCCKESNDKRISREFLLFLRYYGFIINIRRPDDTNDTERYSYNYEMDSEISSILTESTVNRSAMVMWKNLMHNTSIINEIERKRLKVISNRPNQAAFRKKVLDAYGHCIVTDVEMPEVLEAAHIVPFAYKGEDTIANGFLLRSDIHTLFDSGHLRIHPSGDVFLSERARANYGFSIRKHIEIPHEVNIDFLRWRWDNYSGI